MTGLCLVGAGVHTALPANQVFPDGSSLNDLGNAPTSVSDSKISAMTNQLIKQPAFNRARADMFATQNSYTDNVLGSNRSTLDDSLGKGRLANFVQKTPDAVSPKNINDLLAKQQPASDKIFQDVRLKEASKRSVAERNNFVDADRVAYDEAWKNYGETAASASAEQKATLASASAEQKATFDRVSKLSRAERGKLYDEMTANASTKDKWLDHNARLLEADRDKKIAAGKMGNIGETIEAERVQGKSLTVIPGEKSLTAAERAAERRAAKMEAIARGGYKGMTSAEIAAIESKNPMAAAMRGEKAFSNAGIKSLKGAAAITALYGGAAYYQSGEGQRRFNKDVLPALREFLSSGSEASLMRLAAEVSIINQFAIQSDK